MRTRKITSGFTLIELLIVIAIIAILVGIAYPSYTEAVRKGNRSDAKAELNDVAQRLQRCFTAYSVYNNTGCGVVTTYGSAVTSREGLYSVSADIKPTTFTLTATPLGSQIADKCGSLTLTNTGVRGVTGDSATVEECW